MFKQSFELHISAVYVYVREHLSVCSGHEQASVFAFAHGQIPPLQSRTR